MESYVSKQWIKNRYEEESTKLEEMEEGGDLEDILEQTILVGDLYKMVQKFKDLHFSDLIEVKKCENCKGTGVISVDGEIKLLNCEKCSGYGWLPLSVYMEEYPQEEVEESLEDWYKKEIEELEEDPDFNLDLVMCKFLDSLMKEMEEQWIDNIELARKLGKDEYYITNLFRRERTPSLKEIVNIMLALDKTIEINFLKKD